MKESMEGDLYLCIYEILPLVHERTKYVLLIITHDFEHLPNAEFLDHPVLRLRRLHQK
jgi:hypothetical protein